MNPSTGQGSALVRRRMCEGHFAAKPLCISRLAGASPWTGDQSPDGVSMSQAESSRHPHRLWPEPWASHAAMRIAALRGELDHDVAGRAMSEQESAAASTVAAMLDHAEQATHPPDRRSSFRGPL